MLLWVAFSVLSAAAVAGLLWTVQRGGAAAECGESADIAVYRDQITEIEAERQKGLLSDEEATAARTEIGRRLLSRSSAGNAPEVETKSAGPSGEMALWSMAMAVPAAAMALYLTLGSPDLPGQPHQGRSSPTTAQGQVEALIATVEARLRKFPEEGQGWDAIAPIYLRLERYGQAAEAYANANRLLGETPKRLAGFVQAEIMSNNGVVSANARTAAERLNSLEPGRIDVRLWLALSKEQQGAFDEAIADYRALASDANVTGHMRSIIEQRIGIVEKLARGDAVPDPKGGETRVPPSTGPSADQEAMIEGMVARLAAKLAAYGKNPEGWTQLMKSYVVMARRDDALKALVSARTALAGDEAGLAQVNKAAEDLALEVVTEPSEKGKSP